MNTEKWIAENNLIDKFSYMEIDDFIEVIEMLNETHAIVPREPSDKVKEVMLLNQSNFLSRQCDIYNLIIEAAEND